LREHVPELVPKIDRLSRFDAQVTALVVSALPAYVLLILSFGQENLLRPISFLIAGAFITSGSVVAEWWLRRSTQKRIARFFNDLKQRPWKFYEAIALKFATEIARQRARTLGPDSDWGKSRRPLENAVHEVARSLAYWEQRLATDPGNQVAKQQLETAQRLHRKFQEALHELDSRAHVLISFFNQCEARLAVLQSSKRDYEEAQKLGALSERAEDIVADARSTLVSIGNTFLSEAVRVGNALGGLERIGILNLAAAVPVEQVETLADRILESSQFEMTELERLAQEVS
jgi:hypothetical protein